MNETSKSVLRRAHDIRFATRYFVGSGIDIGAGSDSLAKHAFMFPNITAVRSWDVADGDAQLMSTIADNQYDFVHSSHCLEHLHNPLDGIKNWVRICKPGGHLIITIPDEDLYEGGVWPSTHNPDHKTSWTIFKKSSWSSHSINVFNLIAALDETIQVLKIELLDTSYQYNTPRYDQTYHGNSECAIEFVLRKRTASEIAQQGRLPQ